MRKINLVYDCDYDDVDILMVPDHVAEDIERVVMRFNHWLMDSENRKQFLAPYKGRMELSIGTKEILWWINHHERNEKDAVATVYESHTNFCEDYPTADF